MTQGLEGFEGGKQTGEGQKFLKSVLSWSAGKRRLEEETPLSENPTVGEMRDYLRQRVKDFGETAQALEKEGVRGVEEDELHEGYHIGLENRAEQYNAIVGQSRQALEVLEGVDDGALVADVLRDE